MSDDADWNLDNLSTKLRGFLMKLPILHCFDRLKLRQNVSHISFFFLHAYAYQADESLWLTKHFLDSFTNRYITILKYDISNFESITRVNKRFELWNRIALIYRFFEVCRRIRTIQVSSLLCTRTVFPKLI